MLIPARRLASTVGAIFTKRSGTQQTTAITLRPAMGTTVTYTSQGRQAIHAVSAVRTLLNW